MGPLSERNMGNSENVKSRFLYRQYANFVQIEQLNGWEQSIL